MHGIFANLLYHKKIKNTSLYYHREIRGLVALLSFPESSACPCSLRVQDGVVGVVGTPIAPRCLPLGAGVGVGGTPTAATRHGAAGCVWTTRCVFVLGVEGGGEMVLMRG